MEPVLAWSEVEGIPLLSDPEAAEAGLRIAFTTRLGGRSAPPFDSLNLSRAVGDDDAAVTANRAVVTAAMGMPERSLAVAKQVHGADLLWVAHEPDDPVGEGDAVATEGRDAAVGVMSADCVPILLAGETKIAAVHAGWRGLVAGVIPAAVGALGGVHAAWVGPSIRACCYEVGAEVTSAFAAAGLPVAGPDRVDPGQAAVVALRDAGVERVASSPECTSCDDRFFSHRRDGRTGRQGGFIAWV